MTPFLMKQTEGYILDSYVRGEREGIYFFDGWFYLPVRITGLGPLRRPNEFLTKENLRQAGFKDLDEARKKTVVSLTSFVEKTPLSRNTEAFCSPEVLKLFCGVPVLLGHPKEGLLSHANITENRIIGVVVTAFKRSGAVWGVARIYDKDVLAQLERFKSTSPAVLSYNVDGEEVIHSVNHLAFVEEGAWDDVVQRGYEPF